MSLCFFVDLACGVFEDDLMFSEDEDSEVLFNGSTSQSQLKTPAVKGLLNLNRLVRHYSAICRMFICLLVYESAAAVSLESTLQSTLLAVSCLVSQ